MSLLWPEWFMLGILIVVALVAVISSLWGSGPRAVGRFARTVGLPLDGDLELERAVGGRLGSRARWGAIGAAAGAVAGALLVMTGALTIHHEWGPSVSPLAGLALAGLVIAGRGIGTAISILPAPPEVRRHGPRVARVPRPTVADYVAPIERIGARILVAVGSVMALVVAVLPTAMETRILMGSATLAAIAVLIVVEWVSSALVSRPQPAVSEQLLRWDDALRAQTLRDLVSVPLIAGALVVVASVMAWPEPTATSAAVQVVGSTIAYVVLIAMLVVAACSIALRPARYYLKRLWPTQYAETSAPAHGAPTKTAEGA